MDTTSQKNDNDTYDYIDLTPHHQIPNDLGSNDTAAPLTSSTGEPQASPTPAPLFGTDSSQAAPRVSHGESNQSIQTQTFRPFQIPTQSNAQVIQKWKPDEWDDNYLDSDRKNMSLAVMMKLGHQLSLLREFLDVYKRFNGHLGGKQNPDNPNHSQGIGTATDKEDKTLPEITSGPRHKGFLLNIFDTVSHIHSDAKHLRMLRAKKQRGTINPSTMELVAEDIHDKCKAGTKSVWEVMEAKVDMTNEAERAIWVKKKKEVLEDVMEGMVQSLRALGPKGVQ